MIKKNILNILRTRGPKINLLLRTRLQTIGSQIRQTGIHCGYVPGQPDKGECKN